MLIKFIKYLYIKQELLYLFIFIISRLIFVNPIGIFFDSNEYLNVLANRNFINALFIGHFPPLEGYIILFWPIYHIAQFLKLDPSYVVILE